MCKGGFSICSQKSPAYSHASRSHISFQSCGSGPYVKETSLQPEASPSVLRHRRQRNVSSARYSSNSRLPYTTRSIPEDCASSSQLNNASDSQRGFGSGMYQLYEATNWDRNIPTMVGVVSARPSTLESPFLQRSLTDNALKLHLAISRQESQIIGFSSVHLELCKKKFVKY
ncbi:hypothetical protein CH063_02323, partial [Colletotrichum higginsianum]